MGCPAALRCAAYAGARWLRNDRYHLVGRQGVAAARHGPGICSGVSYDTLLCPPWVHGLAAGCLSGRAARAQILRRHTDWAPRLAAACHGQCGS